MPDPNDFYTLKGYSYMEEGGTLTAAMEDYLEMICRLDRDKEIVRIKKISEILHVKPSSASKMANILKDLGYIEFEKYGRIGITEKGETMGEYLLLRHDILHRFFCLINCSDNELTLVEKIEHFIDRKTVDNIKSWLEKQGRTLCLPQSVGNTSLCHSERSEES